MHNDEPVLLDGLDRGLLIEEVGEAIANCMPPQVFGVHGDWGIGKTSFLHQVQWYLTGECPQQPDAEMKKAVKQKNSQHKKAVRTVWFDAWRYQHEEAPIIALLHEMRGQLAWKNRAIRSVSRQVQVMTRGALLSLEELTKKIGFQYSKIRQASGEWATENLAAALPSHTLREHLRLAIEQLLPKKKKYGVSPRLVIFVDDLDRCEPEVAYRLLEGLKVYLTLDNCVFVLGMNQKAIEEAIGRRMGPEADKRSKLRAAAYMEKLCQNVWRLPAVRQPQQVLYDLLEETVGRQDVRDWIRQGVEEAKRQCLPPNPRRLKGLANLIGRLSSRLPLGGTDKEMIFEAQLLVIVAYIYQFHHDLYVRWEAEPNLYNKVLDWCEKQHEELPFLRALEAPLQRPMVDSTQPTSGELESTYPDPTEANVFWIQALILHRGSEIDPESFRRYLHGIET